MKILFSSSPAYGHLYPMLPLARAAVRAGHEVAVATGPDLAPHLADRGFDAWAVGPTFAESWAERNAALPDLDSVPPDQHMLLDVDVLFRAAAAKRAVDLVPRAEAWRPDVVIHEPAEFAAPIAARRAGAVHVTHGLGPTPPAPMRAILEPAMVDLFTAWDAPDLAAAVFASTYLDLCPPTLHPDGDPAFPSSLPLRPSAGDVLPTDELPASLAALSGRDLVYLTLGTVFHDAPEVFEACLAGLRELPIDVVVTVGRDGDPDRLGPQPPGMLVERYVPQALLMPRCRLVIAHGGAGTMLGAFANGLPQLILPQAADQFLNAAAAEAAGAALTLQPGTVTPDTVRAAVRRLLDEASFGQAARTIKAEIAATPAAEDVLATIVAQAGNR
ncbi:glycosyltransferase [Micromonospora sp. CPCC 205371]|nr:glycosyltransferase [Micromonospora sp. CPCC 205371]